MFRLEGAEPFEHFQRSFLDEIASVHTVACARRQLARHPPAKRGQAAHEEFFACAAVVALRADKELSYRQGMDRNGVEPS
jgi:hypothetical protein